MGVPLVSVCCLCVPLRLGCIIIGILSILDPLLGGFFLIYGEKESDLLLFINYITLFMQILLFIASITLLIGIFKNKFVYLKYWVYLALAVDLIVLIYAILTCPFLYSKGTWATTVSYFIKLLFLFYFVLVVHSYRVKTQGAMETAG